MHCTPMYCRRQCRCHGINLLSAHTSEKKADGENFKHFHEKDIKASNLICCSAFIFIPKPFKIVSAI